MYAPAGGMAKPSSDCGLLPQAEKETGETEEFLPPPSHKAP